jgi:hypothetical protein
VCSLPMPYVPRRACNFHGYSKLDKSDIIAAQRIYYHQHWSFTCATSTIPLFYVSHENILADQWLLVTSTNLIGFSAGISHCFASILLRLTPFARRHHAKIPRQTSFDEWVFSVYSALFLTFYDAVSLFATTSFCVCVICRPFT